MSKKRKPVNEPLAEIIRQDRDLREEIRASIKTLDKCVARLRSQMHGLSKNLTTLVQAQRSGVEQDVVAEDPEALELADKDGDNDVPSL